MNKQATEKASELPIAVTDKQGFFERVLLSKLREISKGSLKIETSANSFTFGKDGTTGIKAELQVKNNDFFRKACLGGSLGVADSYADGDWTTNDLVMVFRLFLQNLKVMD